jgi:endonuclease/exonuclease/phosphatase family metal-dependent hydrolase
VEPAARAAVAAVIDTPGGPVRVVNVHLDVALNIPERILQLRPVILEAPDRVVVAGDFNTNDYVWAEATVPLLPLHAVADTSQAVALDRYMRGLGFRTPTAAFGPTWYGFPEDQRLDAIFTRGVEVGDGAVERALTLSDHWPVWLDLEVR